MNPRELIWNQPGYRYLTLLKFAMHGEGIEPPKSYQETPDLQSGAIAALPPVQKFGIVKRKRAHE